MSSRAKTHGAITKSHASAANTIVRHAGFEVVSKPRAVAAYRKGTMSLGDALAVPTVFKDAGKTAVAAAADLTRAFGSADPLVCAREIMTHGTYR